LSGGDLQRREAILLLREICECFSDSLSVNSVLLKRHDKTGNSAGNDYEVHIGIAPAEYEISHMCSIAKKHNLLMRKSERGIVFFGPEPKLVAVAPPERADCVIA